MLEPSTDSRRAPAPPTTVILPFEPPFDWPSLVAFLAPRATPGVEAASPDAYARTFALGGASGTIHVRPANDRAALFATISFPVAAALPLIEQRVRRLFDLDADPACIAAHFASDPILAPLVAARPGLRVPGAWDTFELAVRAILGQQISVSRATTLAGKLVALCGTTLPLPELSTAGLTHLYPAASQLARVENLGLALGMPRARAAAITALAKNVAAEPHMLDPCPTLEASVARLRQIPGIGEWTAQYIAMRALHLSDAFPHSDLGLLRAMQTTAGRPTPAQLLAGAAAWRPWRAYAAMHLWASATAAPLATRRRRGSVS